MPIVWAPVDCRHCVCPRAFPTNIAADAESRFHPGGQARLRIPTAKSSAFLPSRLLRETCSAIQRSMTFLSRHLLCHRSTNGRAGSPRCLPTAQRFVEYDWQARPWQACRPACLSAASLISLATASRPQRTTVPVAQLGRVLSTPKPRFLRHFSGFSRPKDLQSPARFGFRLPSFSAKFSAQPAST